MCHSFGTRHFAHESPLIGMVDSNYTNDDDTKSTSGYVFYFHGCPILTDSSKQRAVSNSTTEAELIAASRCARTCVYLRRLLADFGARNLPPTPIYEDNQGCVAISRGGGNFRRLRHLRVADSYVYHHAVVDNTLSLHYIRSCDNVSDVFTKACDPETFHRLRGYLMGGVSAERKHTHFTFNPLEQSHPRAGECWISSQVSPS